MRLMSGIEAEEMTGNDKRGKGAGYVRKAQQRGIPSRVKRDRAENAGVGRKYALCNHDGSSGFGNAQPDRCGFSRQHVKKQPG